jgi:uncharacterized membrane protein YbhN (UPF0104 family)
VTRRAWPWLRLLIGAGVLAALVWRLGTGAFLNGLRVLDAPSVCAALGIGLLTTLLSAWRWCLVARRLGLALPFPAAVADYYRALLLNAVLPAGVLGDVHRAVSHGRDSGDVARGVRAVFLERTAGQVVLVVVGGAVVLSQPALFGPSARHLAPVAAVAAVVLAVVAAAAALVLRRRPGRFGARWRRGLAAALADARLGLLSRRTWPGVLFTSAATVAGHLALFVVSARVAGLTAPVAQLAPPMLLALLGMGVPVNIGGWGPREAVSALAFGAAGLGAARGLTAAVVYGVLALVASLPGAAVLLARRRRGGVRQPSGRGSTPCC